MNYRETTYNAIKKHGPDLTSSKLRELTGLDPVDHRNALTWLKQNKLVKSKGKTSKTSWSITDNKPDDFGTPRPVATSGNGAAPTGKDPSQRAISRFAKAQEEMIEAFLDVKNYVMTAKEREELQELRAYRDRQLEAIKSLRVRK